MEIKPQNLFYIRFLNPYDPIHWIYYTIKFKDDYELPIVEKPSYTTADFLKHAREFEPYLGEGMSLNPVFEAFKMIATSTVLYNDGQRKYVSDEQWRYMVSMYIGHLMEQTMSRLKNQADEISLTPEKPKEKKLEYSFGMTQNAQWEQTKYGFAFWTMYKPIARFRFFGLAKKRGDR
jgi:hypothetical protein